MKDSQKNFFLLPDPCMTPSTMVELFSFFSNYVRTGGPIRPLEVSNCRSHRDTSFGQVSLSYLDPPGNAPRFSTFWTISAFPWLGNIRTWGDPDFWLYSPFWGVLQSDVEFLTIGFLVLKLFNIFGPMGFYMLNFGANFENLNRVFETGSVKGDYLRYRIEFWKSVFAIS